MKDRFIHRVFLSSTVLSTAIVGCVGMDDSSFDEQVEVAEDALTTVPAGAIDLVQYNASTGKTRIAGWACNPDQTNIEVWIKEQNDSGYRVHRQLRANDVSRPDVVTAGICRNTTTVYGYDFSRMVLSPGTYHFKIRVKSASGAYQDAGNIYGPVTVAESARTAALSNGTLKARVDKMRGALIDNVIDVASGKHWLVNDVDGRGTGTSGMLFGNVNNVLKFSGALVVETGSAVASGEDHVLGDWGNQSQTISSGSNYIWGKAHTVSWGHTNARTFIYNSGLSTTPPTLPAESTATVSSGTSGTAVRFDHEVAFTASNPNIIRVKERMRNHSGEDLKPALWNPPGCTPSGTSTIENGGCYPWPFTNQIHINRFMLSSSLPWYYKVGSTWTYAGYLPQRTSWLQYNPTVASETDLKWAGAGGVVVGGSGGAVGLKCVHENNSPLEGYFVGDLGGQGGILMMAPYWGKHLAGLSGPGEAWAQFGTAIPNGGSRMSRCYFAFSRASNAVSVVQTALDSAAGYSWNENTGF